MRLTQAVTERLRRRNRFYFIGYVLHNVHMYNVNLYTKNIETRLLFGSKSTRVHTHMNCMIYGKSTSTRYCVCTHLFIYVWEIIF